MKIREKLAWYRAHEWLKRYAPTIIAVGGTTGKTATKSAITLALSGQRYVRMAEQPYEEPLDVALAVLGVEGETKRPTWWQLITNSLKRELVETEPDTLVLEYGAPAPGQMDWLVTQLPPDVSVVLRVETHNLEMYTSKDMVAHELASLVVKTKPEGAVVLNVDDELVAAMADKAGSQVAPVGRAKKAAVELEHVERLAGGGLAVHMFIEGKRHSLSLQHVISERQVVSILSALAVVAMLDGDLAKAISNLQQFKPPVGRMERTTLSSGTVLIDDSYSATPESMTEALKTVSALSKQRRRTVVVLGSLPSLAARSEFLHKQIGRLAAEVGDLVILIGPEMRHAATAALQTKETDVHHFAEAADAAHWLPDYLTADDTVLVCGPREAALEQVVEALR